MCDMNDASNCDIVVNYDNFMKITKQSMMYEMMRGTMLKALNLGIIEYDVTNRTTIVPESLFEKLTFALQLEKNETN